MAVAFQSFGGTTPGAVNAFECHNRLTLPDDYRRFLLKHNGGVLDPAACLVKGPDQEVLVQTLLGLERSRDFDLHHWLEEYRDDMPPGFLIVAIGAPALFILSTAGPDVGVHCWDHAHAFDGSSEEDGNTFPVAASFTEFMDSLVTVD